MAASCYCQSVCQTAPTEIAAVPLKQGEITLKHGSSLEMEYEIDPGGYSTTKKLLVILGSLILGIIFLCSWALVGEALLQPGLMVLLFTFYHLSDLIHDGWQSRPSCRELCEQLWGEAFGIRCKWQQCPSPLLRGSSWGSENCLIGCPFDNQGVCACWAAVIFGSTSGAFPLFQAWGILTFLNYHVIKGIYYKFMLFHSFSVLWMQQQNQN